MPAKNDSCKALDTCSINYINAETSLYMHVCLNMQKHTLCVFSMHNVDSLYIFCRSVHSPRDNEAFPPLFHEFYFACQEKFQKSHFFFSLFSEQNFFSSAKISDHLFLVIDSSFLNFASHFAFPPSSCTFPPKNVIQSFMYTKISSTPIKCKKILPS